MQEPHEHPSTRPPSAPVELEALLGGRGLQAVGLISLFLSAAFFFKLAVDHGWVPPFVRVLIGLVAGSVLLGCGVAIHRRPNGNRAIVEGLLALGGALCYLSMWAAGPLFNLVAPVVAFEGMTVVTCILTFLAARHRSQLTALYGVLGGLLTPALLPHSGQQVLLGAYLLALCGGMLLLGADRRFRIVPAVAFLGSLIYAPQFAAGPLTGWTSIDALGLASLFFLEFAIARFIAARRAESVDVLDFVVNAVNIVAYIGLLTIDLQGQRGLLCGTLVALCTVLVAASYKTRGSFSMESLYLWGAMASLALAVLADFEHHTALMCAMFAIQGAAVYAFGLLRKREDLRTTGLAAAALTAPLACIYTYGSPLSTTMYAENLATFGLVAGALFAIGIIGRAKRDPMRIGQLDIAGIAVTLANVVAVIGVADLVFTIPDTFAVSSSQQELVLSVVWTIDAAVIFAVALLRSSRILRWQSLALLVVTIVKVVVIDLASIELIDRVAVCFGLGVVTLVVSAFYLRRLQHNAPPSDPEVL
jgi:uncharacterized membrane protein